MPPIVLSWLWVQRGTASDNAVYMVWRAIRAGFTSILCAGLSNGVACDPSWLYVYPMCRHTSWLWLNPQVDRVDARKWQRVERAGAVVAP